MDIKKEIAEYNQGKRVDIYTEMEEIKNLKKRIKELEIELEDYKILLKLCKKKRKNVYSKL